ncbi:MAG: hypothetical protein KY450_07340 [Actinobacteria bacterium]|nr:hypothetical protein [Actinomycetota bacterium]
MKNLLKKLSRGGGTDRRAELEHEAAEQISSAARQRPTEALAASAHGGGATPDAEAAHHQADAHVAEPPAGRRLTVQERVAARQLQSS